MYPSGQLTDLALRKQILQARIAVRRAECAVAAIAVARPIALVDRGIALWRRASPLMKLMAMPAGVFAAGFLKGKVAGKNGTSGGGKLAGLLSMLPLVLRGVSAMQQMRGGQRKAAPEATERAGVPAS